METKMMNKQEILNKISELHKEMNMYDERKSSCLHKIREYEFELEKLMKESYGQKQLLLD